MSENNPITPENQPIPVPAPDMLSWFEKDREHTRRANELLPANKTVLFDALTIAGITHVIVHFDGYGDAGQLEAIEARSGDKFVEMPQDRIEIVVPIWGGVDVERQTVTIQDDIETKAWTFLKQTHDGWENNDGAYGDFVFDVAERTITLDYNERYTETNFYLHEF
jgi:hypothetical protein